MFLRRESVGFLHVYVFVFCLGAINLTRIGVSKYNSVNNKFYYSNHCRLNHIKCGSGECVAEENLCDGKEDCRDASDESDCFDIPCNTKYLFRCHYGACISKSLSCDGKSDCKDNSDESDEYCAVRRPVFHSLSTKKGKCNITQFHCISGECISESLLCDGTTDCEDNSDETAERCSGFPCPKSTFRCSYGACIARRARCDGVYDCADGSDENTCFYENTNHIDNVFNFYKPNITVVADIR